MQGNIANLSIIKPKQRETPCISARCWRADGRIRTGDLILTKAARMDRIIRRVCTSFCVVRGIRFNTQKGAQITANRYIMYQK